ncbi:putative 26S proteasome regulatory subunit 6B [Paratrimastix pyriformis]|uniref:26S proteasome regulatory subunit 6B n=1 Tax=Paratrimastix pyriformis TaxID=342808 RepID=A0ABQ8UPX1_9EUKA|nr:putative 26S proteasome regulatory subunit 6B [Paratrimastix pyriformis]
MRHFFTLICYLGVLCALYGVQANELDDADSGSLIYASPTGSSDSECGNITFPCNSISLALLRLKQLRKRPVLLIYLHWDHPPFSPSFRDLILLPGLYSSAGDSGIALESSYNYSRHQIRGSSAVDRAVIDCVSRGRAFTLEHGSTFDFFDVTFTNCVGDHSSDEGGGAVLVRDADPTFQRCRFEANSIRGWGGGALCLYESLGGPRAQVIECNFSNNYVDETSGQGGALLVLQQGESSPLLMVIRNCTFTNNSAVYRDHSGGGAVAIMDVSSVRLAGCLFEGNQATRGGAVYVLGAGTDNWIVESTFARNNALLTGGAIALQSTQDVTVQRCTLAENTARNGGGGGLWATFTVGVLIDNCTFAGNYNWDHGGAIYLLTVVARVVITQSQFLRNRAVDGGALACESRVTDLQVRGCLFADNRLDVNTVSPPTGAGGAIFLGNSVAQVDIADSEFRDNMGHTGGAVGIDGDVRTWNLTRCLFHHNYAVSGGGAVSLAGHVYDFGLTNCTFLLNNASQAGAILISDRANATDWTSSAPHRCPGPPAPTANAALADDGGAMSLFGASRFLLAESVFEANHANQSGGALCFTRAFRSNLAMIGGAVAMFDQNTRFQVADCLFDTPSLIGISIAIPCTPTPGACLQNEGTWAGGGLYISGTTSDFTVAGCLFRANRALNYGAGMDVGLATHYRIVDTLFREGQVSDGDGGGLAVRMQSAHFELVGCLFEQNQCRGNGGGVSFSFGVNDFNMTGIVARGNVALNGIEDCTDFAVSGSLIVDNRALSGAGCWMAQSNTIPAHVWAPPPAGAAVGYDPADPAVPSFLAPLLSRLAASAEESAQLWREARAGDGLGDSLAMPNDEQAVGRLTDSLVVGNSAYDMGGGLRIRQIATSLRNVTFDSNTAILGAALSLSSGAFTTSQYCTFTRNEAFTLGGGAFLTEGLLVLLECSFMHNVAPRYGAVAVSGEGVMTAVMTEFSGNQADKMGGALGADGHAVIDLVSCDLTLNSASTGAAFYLSTSSLRATDTRICFNFGSEGGAGYLAGLCKLSLERGCNLSSNIASSFGGALAAFGAADIRLTDVFVSDNQANDEGGGITLRDEASLEAVRTVFSNNYGLTGGALHVHTSQATLSECLLTNNHARLSELGHPARASVVRVRNGTRILDNDGAASPSTSQLSGRRLPQASPALGSPPCGADRRRDLAVGLLPGAMCGSQEPASGPICDLPRDAVPQLSPDTKPEAGAKSQPVVKFVHSTLVNFTPKCRIEYYTCDQNETVVPAILEEEHPAPSSARCPSRRLGISLSSDGLTWSAPFNYTITVDEALVALTTTFIIAALSVVAFLCVLGAVVCGIRWAILQRTTRLEDVDLSALQVQRSIGSGSAGEVFLGSLYGTPVAVKRLFPHMVTTASVHQFQREVSVMRTLRHPNVVLFIGATTQPPYLMVNEFMRQGSLYSISAPSGALTPRSHSLQPLHFTHSSSSCIAIRGRSWSTRRLMALDAARGMNYLHTLHPYTVKVADFGLSRLFDDSQKTFTAAGTPAWIAPEILRGEGYTLGADVYSFGVVLWEICTRRLPFEEVTNVLDLIAQLNAGRILPIPTNCPHLFSHLITQCFIADPRARPSFVQIVATLEYAAAAQEVDQWPNVDATLGPPIPCLPSAAHSVNTGSSGSGRGANLLGGPAAAAAATATTAADSESDEPIDERAPLLGGGRHGSGSGAGSRDQTPSTAPGGSGYGSLANAPPQPPLPAQPGQQQPTPGAAGTTSFSAPEAPHPPATPTASTATGPSAPASASELTPDQLAEWHHQQMVQLKGQYEAHLAQLLQQQQQYEAQYRAQYYAAASAASSSDRPPAGATTLPVAEEVAGTPMSHLPGADAFRLGAPEGGLERQLERASRLGKTPLDRCATEWIDKIIRSPVIATGLFRCTKMATAVTSQQPAGATPGLAPDDLVLYEKVKELESAIENIRLQAALSKYELANLQRELVNAREEIKQIRAPPLLIGQFLEMIDTHHAIVGSTAGPNYIVRVLSTIDRELLKPSTTVALHRHSNALIDVLPPEADSTIQLMSAGERPDVSYSEIGGCDVQKQEIREAVELPLTQFELYKQIGIDPPRGVLLYGPPGTGKTMLAKAVAHHTTAAFIRVVGSEFVQKYLGEGPRMVRDVFRLARENSPAIVFIDEIDAIATKRFDAQTGADREVQRILLELLNQMDGFDVTTNVKVIMATNRADTLDPALLRPGRLDRKIEFPLPDRRQKRLIFQVITSKMNLSKDVDLEDYVSRPDKISGADIAAICQEAGMQAVRKNRYVILPKDFEKGYKAHVKKSELEYEFYH